MDLTEYAAQFYNKNYTLGIADGKALSHNRERNLELVQSIFDSNIDRKFILFNALKLISSPKSCFFPVPVLSWSSLYIAAMGVMRKYGIWREWQLHQDWYFDTTCWSYLYGFGQIWACLIYRHRHGLLRSTPIANMYIIIIIIHLLMANLHVDTPQTKHCKTIKVQLDRPSHQPSPAICNIQCGHLAC